MDNDGNNLGKIDTTVMKECRHKWNLANDVDLLKRLETFSQHVLNNTTYALNCMDSLEENLNKTFLNVRTITNNFHAIADNQFIENRVQEEEDTFAEPSDESSSMEWTTERSHLQLNLHQSLKKCADILEKKFEAIDIPGSDSEDEAAIGRQIMLIPKNIYKDRPLPHLIGSEAFMNDETLGLSLLNLDEEIVSESDQEFNNQDGVSSDLNHSEDCQMIPETNKILPNYIPESLTSDYSGYKFGQNEFKGDTAESNISKPTDQRLQFGNGSEESSETDGDSIKTYNSIKDNYVEPVHPSPPEKVESPAVPDIKTFKADLSRVLSMGRNAGFHPKKPEKKSPVSPDDLFSSLDDANQSMDVDVENSSDFLFKSPSEPKPRSSLSESNKQLSIEGVTTNSQGCTDLPCVTTKVLHSLAKGRAKIQSKRRLPSRRHRKEGFSSGAQSTYESEHGSSSRQTTSSSAVMSPSTDEEDLFVLPAFDFPKDVSSNNLFFGNTLLSPGVSIDAEKSDFETMGPSTSSSNMHNSLSSPLNLSHDKDEHDPLWLPTSDGLAIKPNNKFSWNDMDSSDMDDLFSTSSNQTKENILKTTTYSKVSIEHDKEKVNVGSEDSDIKQAVTFGIDQHNEDLFSTNIIDDEDDFLANNSGIFGSDFKKSAKSKTTHSLFTSKFGDDDDEDDEKLFSSGFRSTDNNFDDLFSTNSLKKDNKKTNDTEDLFSGSSSNVKDPLLFSDDLP